MEKEHSQESHIRKFHMELITCQENMIYFDLSSPPPPQIVHLKLMFPKVDVKCNSQECFFQSSEITVRHNCLDKKNCMSNRINVIQSMRRACWFCKQKSSYDERSWHLVP